MTARRTQAGFTLLELLVVLAIAGTLMSLVPPAAGRAGDGARLRGAVQALAGSLALARSAAVMSNADAVFVLDLANRRYGVSGPGGGALDGRLDADLRIALTTDARDTIQDGDRAGDRAGGRGAIRFHPDGGSPGGEVRVANRAGAMVIRVDWLTGRTRILPDTDRAG
ncbi:GspH/FimT family pseudopilin [Azospirillum griseum]|uniref:Type II secretion system protein H n=1 Tax=Azospirillum griseum TaxID=2496639 RepID=A0A3S0HYD0_9PROT|nr:GspH/FimT family pseudopilin [Azospirillum griseum]RTR16766.1 prepilin-type N-terminal cleavage/methylation domain-containing protein [Azospirillum griseum]